MEQPPKFVAKGEYGHVYRLWKALYGLKQSPCVCSESLARPLYSSDVERANLTTLFFQKHERGCHSPSRLC